LAESPAIFDKSYPGIAMQAISLTFGVMFVMFALAYKMRIVQATRGYQAGRDLRRRAALLRRSFTSSSMGMSLFFFHTQMSVFFLLLRRPTPLGIGISPVRGNLSRHLNLIIDFRHDRKPGPGWARRKYMEW